MTARAGGYLAIPIDDNLTPAGVPRYTSPLDPEIINGRFLETDSGKLYYVNDKKKGKLKAGTGRRETDLEFLFALRKSVIIPGPKAPGKKTKSRFGFTENAIGAGPRKALRRKLVLANRRAVQAVFGGGSSKGSGGGLAGPRGPLPG